MWLLSGATVLALLKVLVHLEQVDLPMIEALSWWWVLGGYALTAAWFTYADRSGLTRRKAMQRQEKRKAARLLKLREMLGSRRKR